MHIVHQCTELVNALRAILYEYDEVVPIGIGHIKRIKALLKDEAFDIPEMVRD